MQDSIRRLRYRLKRQGMLELDEWLGPVGLMLDEASPEMLAELALFLDREPAELLDVMHGRQSPPECLRDVLAIKSDAPLQ